MKCPKLILLYSAIAIPLTIADPANAPKAASLIPAGQEIATSLVKHGEGAKRLAHEQDELSADVQDLIDEQTDAEIIELLRAIEIIMADATDLLEQKETGGATIATETEVIEKIFEAAKKKKQKRQEGGG